MKLITIIGIFEKYLYKNKMTSIRKNLRLQNNFD